MCFPVASIIAVLIWCVIIGAVVAIIRLLIGWIGPRIGFGGDIISLLMQIFMIILWAVIAIAIISIVGQMIVCLIGLAPNIGHLSSR